MKIVTWNVNSIRARLESLTHWLSLHRPDIVLLQETKVTDDAFPKEPLEDLGYNIAVHGQKSYNGTAILSKFPLEDISAGLPGEEDRPAARYLELVSGGIRAVSLYVPNGSDFDSPKYNEKGLFLENLAHHLEKLLTFDEALVIGGDFNIAPHDVDTHDPQVWRNSVLSSPRERAFFRRLLNLGFTDALRTLDPHTPLFTWWDYRSRGFETGKGLRIDHFLLSPRAAERLVSGGVDSAPRGNPRPSDHAPVFIDLRD